MEHSIHYSVYIYIYIYVFIYLFILLRGEPEAGGGEPAGRPRSSSGEVQIKENLNLAKYKITEQHNT